MKKLNSHFGRGALYQLYWDIENQQIEKSLLKWRDGDASGFRHVRSHVLCSILQRKIPLVAQLPQANRFPQPSRTKRPTIRGPRGGSLWTLLAITMVSLPFRRMCNGQIYGVVVIGSVACDRNF